MTSEADSLVRLGADQIYNVEFDSARANFQKVQKLYPDHPAGYFLDAMVDWWRIKIHRYEEKFEDEFLDNIDLVIKKCDKLLLKDEKDLTALFFKGGALGYRGQYYAYKEEWINAATDGKEAYDLMIKSYLKAPGNHDMMLGTGIYNYFAEALPEKYPIAKPFTIFLPPGDLTLGIKQLKACFDIARYSNIEAAVVLMMIYYSFEKDYRQAMYWSKLLHEKYPQNPYFHRYLGRCYNKLGRWKEVEKIWREIVNNGLDRMEGYNNKNVREGLYYIGLSLKRKREYDISLKYFLKCMEVSDFIDEEDTGFYLAAQVKVANLYDILGEKEKAIKTYKQILKDDDYDNSHKIAKRYLDKND